MESFMMLVFMALLIEAIVNLFKNIDDKNTSWKYWASLIVGVVISTIIAVNWDLDLFKMVGLSDGKIPYLGAGLTGILLSRGSNVVSDLLSRLNSKP